MIASLTGTLSQIGSALRSSIWPWFQCILQLYNRKAKMATQLSFPSQFLDDNADPVVGTDVLKFYDTGTTTPREIFADSTLTTSLGFALDTDGGGRVENYPVYVSPGTGVKMVVENGSVIETIDPVNVTSTSASSAVDSTFNPVTGNAADNVQEAIENATQTANANATALAANQAADQIISDRLAFEPEVIGFARYREGQFNDAVGFSFSKGGVGRYIYTFAQPETQYYVSTGVITNGITVGGYTVNVTHTDDFFSLIFSNAAGNIIDAPGGAGFYLTVYRG